LLRLAGTIILLVGLCFVGSAVRAQSAGALTARDTRASGILPDRLSAKDYQRWEAIKRIVFAEDASGPLHPTLHSLWRRLERSGHAVYIEFRSTGNAISNMAGAFNIELFDPLGLRHVAVIRLYPDVIDKACVSPAAARANGFIPFQRLSKQERYAEVLGHELAHAVDILTDLTRARLVFELVEQTNQEFHLQGRRFGYANLKPEMLERLSKRDEFLKELEEPVEAIEIVIWSEIASSRELKDRKRVTTLSTSRAFKQR
jgi:hypothetical protein